MTTVNFREIQQKAGEYTDLKNNIDCVLQFEDFKFIYNFDLN